MAAGAPSRASLDPGAASSHLHGHGDPEQAEGTSQPTPAKLRLAWSIPPPLDTSSRPSSIRPGLDSRRSSYITQIDQILPDDHIDPNTYGVTEGRDGFFDAIFLKLPSLTSEQLFEHSKATLPAEFDKGSPLAPARFIPRQLHEIKSLIRRVTTTRSGIRLLRSFTAYFVAYVLCLVPVVRNWLGRYHYIMAISVILNHPARDFGCQLEGALFTTIGTAAGLGWGVVGLLLSTSTLAASTGYGGILALSLALFMATAAWIRSYFTRFYQIVLCAGIAITFTTLAETRSRSIEWAKLLSYGIPWLFGQALALVVNCCVFPEAGSRPLATALHQSFCVMQDALIIPRPRDTRLRRRLAQAFIDLSAAYRDMRISLTITRFRPDDVRELRNLMQAVLRALLAMETETALFSEEADEEIAIIVEASQLSPSPGANDPRADASEKGDTIDGVDVTATVTSKLAKPTREILSCMEQGLQTCQAALMDLSGYRRHLGPPMHVSSDLPPIQIRIKQAKAAFDAVESELLESGRLPAASMDDSAVVQLFVFARHIREAASTIENLMAKVNVMKRAANWPRLHLPSYPWRKAAHCANEQVRHDRGGATAGSYQVTFHEISHALEKIKAREYKPLSEAGEIGISENELQPEMSNPTIGADSDPNVASRKDTFGFKIWRILHLLQGYDSRYAFKVVLVTSLLSVPSYLEENKDWWDDYEAWWAVAMSWILFHTRVGGNIQDLVTRALAAILGAAWSGAAYAAGNGNPYVIAVFAAIYMLPMMYRFTQSSHPRSGLVGCFSFTIISLRLQVDGTQIQPAVTAVLKGLSFFVGTVTPIVVNWVLWPFVARHELRKSLSSMMFFLSIIYRNVVAKYIYFQEGKEPTPEDIEKSEVLEARIREGFVRMRQLLVMTRHEIRLRAPFDPLPYSALADSCERFFEYLIAVRQSAVFYNPGYIRDNPVAAQRLLSFRRDAVAAILANLYILAGALRSHRKVPRYLPSAAAARKRLLLETVEVEAEMAQHGKESDVRWHKKWSDIYSYSYNESLTGCVAQLEELEKYTKLIVGEQGFDDDFKFEGEDEGEDDENNGNNGVHN